MSAVTRFWQKVVIADPDGCWEWQGATAGRQGHGQFWHADRKVYAHRWAYEYLVGPIPEGLEIDHLCRNPPCVNPMHMEPVTSRENSLRGVGFAAVRARQTECIHGHPLDGLTSHGTRCCLTCRQIYNARRRAERASRRQVCHAC